MTREQHADEAERLLARARDPEAMTEAMEQAVPSILGRITWEQRAALTHELVAMAQVHATLANMPYEHCCDAGED